MWGIRFKTGGELPLELSGLFNKKHLAQRQVEQYIAAKQAIVDSKKPKLRVQSAPVSSN